MHACRTSSANNHHFYFNQIVRLWNQLPVIDLSLPPHIIQTTTHYMGSLHSQLPIYVLVIDAQDYRFPLTFFLFDQLRITIYKLQSCNTFDSHN